jgi:hypothetical protein
VSGFDCLLTCVQCLMTMHLGTSSRETSTLQWTLLGCVNVMVVLAFELISSSQNYHQVMPNRTFRFQSPANWMTLIILYFRWAFVSFPAAT